MFKKLEFIPPTASRQYKRLAIVAERTRANPSQRATYNNAITCLSKMQKHKRQHANTAYRQNETNSLYGKAMNINSNNSVYSDNDKCNDSEFSVQTHRKRQQIMYDDVDPQRGESQIQMWFNELVHSAILKYGPPLPAEFAASNHITSSSYTPWHYQDNVHGTNASTGTKTSTNDGKTYTLYFHGGTIRRVSADTLHRNEHARSVKMRNRNGDDDDNDKGADGKTFVFYDEVALKTHELFGIIKREKPDFSLAEDCDNVPFALLIKNCPYFRVFGGKVRYTRYLYRTSHAPVQQHEASHRDYVGDDDDGDDKGDDRTRRGSIEVSIAKYKMREVPSFDNIRQGPQPWRFRSS